jgi:hypothetical protein
VVSKGEDDQDGDGHGDDQTLRIVKEAQGKCIMDRSFFLVW